MKILICSDGSEQAERAVRVGAAIAAGTQAQVTLFGIVEAPGQAKSLIESLQRSQGELQNKKVETELLTRSGKLIEETVKRTREVSYDLVIIGAVRKEARGRFLMSSKACKIIKEIEPPVLSVTGESAVVRKILVCSGGKHYIDTAVRLAGQIAQAVGAAVTLLHVMPEPPAIYAHLPRIEESADWLLQSRSELGLHLRHAKETLENLNVPTQVRLRTGPVLEEVLREIHAGSFDLAVTGSALSRSLRSYVLGDISREIVNRANCAVLVVRSQPVPVGKFSLKSLFERLGV